MKKASTAALAISLTVLMFWAVDMAKTWAKSAGHGASSSMSSSMTTGHFFKPADIKWMPAPPMLPAGAKVAILAGDPTKSGPFTMRLQAPAGYMIPAHWHSQTENVTVISGTLRLGMGNKLDKSKGQALPAGAFASMPAKMRHFAWSQEKTIVQLHGTGPFDIHYVNAADDPRHTRPAKKH
jgi:hypothetical protein